MTWALPHIVSLGSSGRQACALKGRGQVFFDRLFRRVPLGFPPCRARGPPRLWRPPCVHVQGPSLTSPRMYGSLVVKAQHRVPGACQLHRIKLESADAVFS
jgi:hypothetical protein